MRAAALLLLLAIPLGQADVSAATPLHVYAGGSLLGFYPLGEELDEVYSLGFGVGAEFGLSVGESVRFTLGASPSFSSGEPATGPLAGEGSSRLWSIPFTATCQLAVRKWPKIRSYLGAGLTVEYLREGLSFTGPLGSRDQARSYTPVGFHGQIGIEQNRPRRFFGELWFLTARAGQIEGGHLGREVGGLQMRIGFRGDL